MEPILSITIDQHEKDIVFIKNPAKVFLEPECFSRFMPIFFSTIFLFSIDNRYFLTK